jgi:hypothetical protein
MTQGCALRLYRPGSRSLWIGAWAIVLSLFAPLISLNAADAPPVDAAKNNLRAIVQQLNDPKPAARSEARQKLLNLKRKDLVDLRTVLQERLPLTPCESDGLYDIVTHVYLSDYSYIGENARGFLGVIFEDEQRDLEPECGGVEIRKRMPGFCGFRYFDDGDVVLALSSPQQTFEPHSYPDVQDAIKSFSAGQTVMFRILRRGKVILVPVVLDAMPREVGGNVPATTEFIANRNAAANAYWEETFLPLVGD